MNIGRRLRPHMTIANAVLVVALVVSIVADARRRAQLRELDELADEIAALVDARQNACAVREASAGRRWAP